MRSVEEAMEPISACLVSPPPVNDGKQCEREFPFEFGETETSQSHTLGPINYCVRGYVALCSTAACVSDVQEVLLSDSLTARAETESTVEQTPKASPLPLGARLKQGSLPSSKARFVA